MTDEWKFSPKLIYDPEARDGHKWAASTFDDSYDGSGATPLDAITALVIQFSKEQSTE